MVYRLFVTSDTRAWVMFNRPWPDGYRWVRHIPDAAVGPHAWVFVLLTPEPHRDTGSRTGYRPQAVAARGRPFLATLYFGSREIGMVRLEGSRMRHPFEVVWRQP